MSWNPFKFFDRLLFRYQTYPIVEKSNRIAIDGLQIHLLHIGDLKEKLKIAGDELYELKKFKRPGVSDAKSWNDRYVRHNVYYAAPDRLEVKKYIRDRKIDVVSDIAKGLILKWDDLFMHDDNIPLFVMRWIRDSGFKYEVEIKEWWKTPEETLKDWKIRNDCDDIMIFEYYLIREIFKQIEKWEEVKHRLKCQDLHIFSRSRDPNINRYVGRHACCLWLCDDNEWYTVESIGFMLKRAINIWKRIPQRKNFQYGQINYTFNEQHTWAQKTLHLDGGDYGKN